MSGLKESDDAPESAKLADNATNVGVAVSDEAGAAMAAILHLLRLISAELVLFRGLDVERFEKAMREKIGEFTSPTPNQQSKGLGLAFARKLVDQILVQVRAQVELKKQLGASKPVTDSVPPTPPLSSPLLH